MRKLIFATVLMVVGLMTTTTAQERKYEIKVNPLNFLLSGDFTGGFEYLKSDRIGFEFMGSYQGGNAIVNMNSGFEDYEKSGIKGSLMAKYYLKPKFGADRSYIGLYGKLGKTTYTSDANAANAYVNNKGSVGLMFGKKWVKSSGFYYEAGVGLGRVLHNENTLVEGSQLDVENLPTGNSLEVPMRLAVGIRF